MSCLQLAFVGVIYPCLMLQYMGQAAFLSKNIPAVHNSFYLSIPSKLQNTKYFCALLLHILPKDSVDCWIISHHACRSFILACVCHSNSCCNCGQPSYYICNFFYREAVPCLGMLSTSKGCAYFKVDLWPDLHTWDKLDSDGPLFSYNTWLSWHNSDRKCLW